MPKDNHHKEIEKKFEKVSDLIKQEFKDEAVIVYTQHGIIAMGSPISLAMTYAKCDNEMQKVLKDQAAQIGEELIGKIMGDDSKCDNPECPVHGDEK